MNDDTDKILQMNDDAEKILIKYGLCFSDDLMEAFYQYFLFPIIRGKEFFSQKILHEEAGFEGLLVRFYAVDSGASDNNGKDLQMRVYKEEIDRIRGCYCALAKCTLMTEELHGNLFYKLTDKGKNMARELAEIYSALNTANPELKYEI